MPNGKFKVNVWTGKHDKIDFGRICMQCSAGNKDKSQQLLSPGDQIHHTLQRGVHLNNGQYLHPGSQLIWQVDDNHGLQGLSPSTYGINPVQFYTQQYTEGCSSCSSCNNSHGNISHNNRTEEFLNLLHGLLYSM